MCLSVKDSAATLKAPKSCVVRASKSKNKIRLKAHKGRRNRSKFEAEEPSSVGGKKGPYTTVGDFGARGQIEVIQISQEEHKGFEESVGYLRCFL